MATIERGPLRSKHSVSGSTLPFEAIKNSLQAAADAKQKEADHVKLVLDETFDNYFEYEKHNKKAALSLGKIAVEPFRPSETVVPETVDPVEFALQVRSTGKQFGARVASIFMADVIGSQDNTSEALHELKLFARDGYYVNPLLVTLELTRSQIDTLSDAETVRLGQLDAAMSGLAVPTLHIVPNES